MEVLKLLWMFALFGTVLMYGSYGVFVDLCKVNGKIPFLTASPVLITEILKLLLCLLPVITEKRNDTTPVLTFNEILPFALPALCYAINNNLAVFMQTQMDPATYMILGNLKIVTTAILYRAIMKKEFCKKQLVAISLLTSGGILNSTCALKEKSLALSEIHITLLGLCTLVCYCFISGFAGVFTEYILKKHLEMSVFYQNVLLYIFGVVFNCIFWIIQAHQKYTTTNLNYFYIFQGYSVFTWLLIITQAVTGIIFSMIMKYNNNIVRLFIIAAAPLVTTALSYYLLELHIHGEFVVSAFLILIASVSYYSSHHDDNKT